MFGGSPMSVAVPHRFEAIIIGITNLTGLSWKILEIDIATGVIKKIVVTLSRKAESIAVIKKKDTKSRSIFPLDISNNFTAIHSKRCVCHNTPTIIIIPTRSAITSPSIEVNAWWSVRTWSSGIKWPKAYVRNMSAVAIKKTTNVLCTFSVATSVITKNITSDTKTQTAILKALGVCVVVCAIASDAANDCAIKNKFPRVVQNKILKNHQRTSSFIKKILKIVNKTAMF